MDDLTSVAWNASKPATANQHPFQASGNNYPALRPTPPLSGSSTPSALQSSQRQPNNVPSRSNASTPGNDSFANLVSFGTSQPTKNLSLQEQQKRLHEEKARQESEKRRQFNAQLGSVQAAAWGSLGDGRTIPNGIMSPPIYRETDGYGSQRSAMGANQSSAGAPGLSSHARMRSPAQDEDDLLAAFNASAPVDASSHMPPPSTSPGINTIVQNGRGSISGTSSLNAGNATNGVLPDQDDDPFGLGAGFRKISPNGNSNPTSPAGDDDDILGLLGRPVSEFSKSKSVAPEKSQPSVGSSADPHDRAIAELVDMGFDPEKSKIALESSGSGVDVQAAVSWLISQAHKESRHKSPKPRAENAASQSKRYPGRRRSSASVPPKAAWMTDATQKRSDSKSPVNGEKDSAQYASEFGNKVFKTANSFWKTSTKKLNQVVSELNSDSDSSRPRWMREKQPDSKSQKRRHQQPADSVDGATKPDSSEHRHRTAVRENNSVTDEALMLEANGRPPPQRSRREPEVPHTNPQLQKQQAPESVRNNREQAKRESRLTQQAPVREPKAKINKASNEDDFQAYISPARRKKPTIQPTLRDDQPDLLVDSSQPKQSIPTVSRPKLAAQSDSTQTSLPIRPVQVKRHVPHISAFAQKVSAEARKAGNEAFKRGDYALATSHYSTAISALPSTHPLILPLLTNRALSHSKTGDPKASIADAVAVINLIGPSRGSGETVDLGPGEGLKQMTTYWEKAMMRHAEALEHLERWPDAAAIWRACVETGVGGATSIAGRNRCEKAAAGPSQAKPAAAPKTLTPKPRPKASALGDFARDSESVSRLRAANAAADRLDDEKFGLADAVDSRISRWRAGKEGNLRALLSTLEIVLWEGSGWKKVTMGDVLLPAKVKLIYMKGIAKVHPDKLPPKATTEHRMISAAVFATLNEAWERFKQENGL